MKLNFSFRKGSGITLTLLALSACGLSLEAAPLGGKWIQHPAATLRSAAKESQVDRIIEGNRYVYFSVRGSNFNRSTRDIYSYSVTYNIDSKQIFIYDKTQPWGVGAIRPLAQEFELSGVFPEVINYSAKDGVLAVVNENNTIDFIYDDGTHVSSRALLNAAIPKSTVTPYTVTFDDEKPLAYVAGSFGYAVVNRQTGELENFVQTDLPVSWAGRTGDEMVLFAGTFSVSSYATQTYRVPFSTSGQIKLTDPLAGLNNLQALMPLGDDTFAAIAPGSADTSKSLKLITLVGNEVKTDNLADNITADNGALWNYRRMFHSDGCFQGTKDGYTIQSKDRVIILHKDGSTDTVSKSSLSANEGSSKAASLDGSKIWVYTYEDNGTTNTDARGFYSYDYAGSGWSNKSEIVAPNAPSCSYLTFAEYNPKYGMIFRGSGSTVVEEENDVDRLCSYKDGVWSDISYVTGNPAFSFPTRGAKHVCTDPLNSDWIWGASNQSGLHRTDLGNYSNFLELGSTYYNNYPTTYPGYFTIFPWQDAWKEMLIFSNIDFDNKGTMWFARNMETSSDMFDVEDIYNANLPIYYLTAEERQNMAEIGSDSSAIPDLLGRELNVPYTLLRYNSRLLALKAPTNENILVLSHGWIENKDNRHVVVYDHNGTPGDKTDDRYALLDEITDENGEKVLILYQKGLYEDPATGEVWMMSLSGPFIFNPADVLDGKKMVRRPRVTRREGIETDENPFEFISITNIADDFMGRKWLATEEGLYCLSKDGTDLLGHYTPDNSPIPSINVFNVACSPDGAVFVLTDRGMAEFRPDGSNTPVAPTSALSIWPFSVAPDYNGYVTIYGAETGSEYVVCDKDGKEIVSLGSPDSSNTIQWDCKAEDGVRVKAGKYVIKRRNVDESHTLIVL